LNSYVMVRLLMPDCPLNRGTAKRIVELFLEGAAGSPHGPSGEKKIGKGPLNSRKKFRRVPDAGLTAIRGETKKWAGADRVPIKFKQTIS
jgi:hypothetical protein